MDGPPSALGQPLLTPAQNPAAIDAGVFHNDVIAVGNESVLFCHEAAFRDRAMVLRELRRKFAALRRHCDEVVRCGRLQRRGGDDRNAPEATLAGLAAPATDLSARDWRG